MKKINILNKIKENQSFLIMSHLHPDGDAIGSALALSKGLIKLNKDVKFILLDEIPFDVQFLNFNQFTINKIEDFQYDIIFALDSSDLGRLKDKEIFLNKPIINIDHHKTNTKYGDINWIDENASATGELVYKLLKELDVEFDEDIAQDLYVAIATDTGNFIYSNTTQYTHIIVADLMKFGINIPKISRHLYQNIPINKFRFDTNVLNNVEFYYNNLLAILLVTNQLKKKFNCDNTDGLVESIRNIQGVEVAILIVERGKETKISMRSKDHIDVALIAQKYQGGGHKNAAGFSSEDSTEKTKAIIIKEFEYLD